MKFARALMPFITALIAVAFFKTVPNAFSIAAQAAVIVVGLLALAASISVPTLDWIILRLQAHRAGIIGYRKEWSRTMEVSTK